MLSSIEMAEALVKGLILGGAMLAVAYRYPRRTSEILAGVLIFAAVGYVAFVFAAGESLEWLALELLGVAIYGTMAVKGVRGSPWWLVAGWTLHPVWDFVLHYFGPGGTFAPTWWTVPCVSWDLLAAGYIAWRVLRGTHPSPAHPAVIPSEARDLLGRTPEPAK